MLHLGIFGSGSGSNFQSILDAVRDGTLSAKICCVLSDVAEAGILEKARRAGIPSFHLDCSPFKSKLDGPAQDRAIAMMNDHGVDTIALAGFMRMVKPPLLAAFPTRVLNIHPSLLPAFPGLAAWKQACDYGAKITGCTVHFVDAGMDTGPIILQKSVPVLPGDSPETLHARILEQEHLAYPEALRALAENRIVLHGRTVLITNT
ncbi:MAG TPA: phosphoribosylglycinamide formyltransferase [Kiritimatiellia bacterium]|nr:phosphoribosylglycinamide formyltransferase [Kiritimatiellia bacterium]